MAYIKINPRKVYETGMKYENWASDIAGYKKELETISDNINIAWSGDATHNFQVSFKAHIEKLTDIINALDYNGKILKENALNHSISDNNLGIKMERSDMDESTKL